VFEWLQFESGSTFYEVSVMLIITVLIGLVGLLFRQPLIVSYILAGILLGATFLQQPETAAHMELLSSLGISILLFIVGLKLDLTLIRTTGVVALMTGLGQIVFTSVIGYFIALGLGMSPLTSGYVAVALTFSSTIIIVKLLTDKREIDSLHGRVALGFLIVQDLAVVFLMIGLSAMGLVGEKANLGQALGEVLLNGFFLLVGITVFIRYVAERLMRQLSRVPELLLLFALGWAFILAALTEEMGFSQELGALLAGVSMASTSYRDVIGSRLVSVRDFLVLFFFLNLGSHIQLDALHAQLVPAILLSLFVLIGNPLIVLIIMGWMGYRSRTSFLAGLTVAQISEFSLIFATLGMELGHIDASTVALVTLVGLITIGLSTYMILYSQPLYDFLSKPLSVFERRDPFRERRESMVQSAKSYDAIIFGFGRYGKNLAYGLKEQGYSVLGIDFDPQVVQYANTLGFEACYGDAGDPNFMEILPLQSVRWVVVAIPPLQSSLTEINMHTSLVHALRAHGFGGHIALTAYTDRDADTLKVAGADLLLLPYADAAQHAVAQISETLSR
jgi:Kef-type K+ transport system membrane component KefB